MIPVIAAGAAAAALFAFLFILARGRVGTGENLIQRGLIALCLFLAAACLGLTYQPEQTPEERVFYLVEEGLLLEELESVAREVHGASLGREASLVSFRHPGRRGRASGSAPATNEAVVVDARFSSPAAALAWVGMETAEGTRPTVTVLSSSRLRLPKSEWADLRYRVLPFRRTGETRFDLALPDEIFEGRSLKVKLSFRSSPAKSLALLLYDGPLLRERREIRLEGEGPVTTEEFELEGLRPGTHLLRFDVEAAAGELLQREYRRVDVRPPPRTAWLGKEGQVRPLAEMLKKSGYPVTSLPDTEIAAAAVAGEYEILVLEDVATPRLSWPVISRLYRAVSVDGKGLLVIGGEKSYGPGGYTGSAVERLMPVWMGLKNKEEEKHSTAFVVIVDTSTSMLCPPEGCPSDAERMWGDGREARGPRVRKIDLARQALLNLVPSMKGADYFGILAGRASPFWEVEPGVMANMAEVEEDIMGIRGGGSGIHLYSSLLAARDAMEEAESEIKHIVALIDTDDVDEIRVLGEGSVEDLILVMRENDISISFIGLGFSDDRYVPLLNRLASTTGGYLYLSSSITEVPTFLSDDREKLSRHQVIRRHLLTQFSRKDFPSLESTPSLEGQFITEAKADARTLVWSELGYPVFALRQMGKGVSAAFATDGGSELAPSWGGEDSLPAWDGIFTALREKAPGEEDLFFSRRGRRVTVWFTPAEEQVSGRVTAVVEGRRTEPFSQGAEEVFPGVYRAALGYLPGGSYRVSLAEEGVEEALSEAVIAVRDEAASETTAAAAPPLPALPREEDRTGPLADRWLRLLLTLSAACAVAYEMIRQK